MMRRWPTYCFCLILTASALAFSAGSGMFGECQRAYALTPQSPQVRQAISKGVVFLKANSDGSHWGNEVLVALALVKSPGVDAKDPRIQKALSKVRGAIGAGQIQKGYAAVYNTGLAIVFLSALHDTRYRPDISAALKALLTMQGSHGGFVSSAKGEAGGDTSMTQYAVLGMWEAAAAGVRAPPQAWQRVTNWLLKTQRANGGFVYDPQRDGGMALPVTHSMAAAGLGSLYICANYTSSRGRTGKKKDDKVSSVFQPVGKKKKEAGPGNGARISIDLGRLRNGLLRGDAWIQQNLTVKPTYGHTLYYFYALERYFAFRERWEKKSPAEPQWYTTVAAHLVETQAGDGSWKGTESSGISTAFAVLFLVRSTKTSLDTHKEDVAAGTLVSGSGLPTDLSQIKVKNGQVVVKALAGPFGELLDIMEDPNDPRLLQAVEGFGDLILKADDAMLSPHLLRLRKLAKNGTPAARAAAVKGLAKTRKLDYVPTLIYALADDHPAVVLAARDGLRFLSRKFNGFGLSIRADNADKAKAIEKWKDWYRSIRPDADFE